MAKIIVADDNKELLSMISEFLKMQPNMDVIKTFTGGKDLLQYLETDTADILLLDVFMPDLDGVNTLSEINNNHKYHRPKKIVILTAFNTEALMAKASALGADYFIVKPIDLGNLHKTLTQLMSETQNKGSTYNLKEKADEPIDLDTGITEILHEIGTY